MFSDTTNAPKVYLENEPSRREGLTYIALTDAPQIRYRQVSTVRYEFRGLTRAAADAIAAAKTDAHTTAKSERMNDAGMYKVSVTTQTVTTWA